MFEISGDNFWMVVLTTHRLLMAAMDGPGPVKSGDVHVPLQVGQRRNDGGGPSSSGSSGSSGSLGALGGADRGWYRVVVRQVG